MKTELNIALVQAELHWEDPTSNREKIEALLSDVKEADLVVLPEMFTTGFTMNATAHSEDHSGPTMQWMKQVAAQHAAVVTGSIIIQEGDRFYNRLIWMEPTGEFKHYDKRHLFSFADEPAHFSGGADRLICELKGWKICPLICYDLRFPVWSRNQSLTGQSVDHVYDALIYVANWPSARKKAWVNLLEARAHENQAYAIGVNRVGQDGNGIEYDGNSLVFDPKGNTICSLNEREEGVALTRLKYDDLESYRQKFTAWNDKDSFQLSSPSD